MNKQKENPMVFIVDDDKSVRKSLMRLIKSIDLQSQSFSSAQEYLDSPSYDGPACLVADVRMPGLSGLDLQEKLLETGRDLPTIFITGHGDIPMSVQAMKKGAVDFLTKPYNDQNILDAIQQAVKKGVKEKAASDKLKIIQNRFKLLTPREKEVCSLVVRGMFNKQVAYDMNISEKTVKVHRARVMEKMKADSLADLVRMAERLKISSFGR